MPVTTRYSAALDRPYEESAVSSPPNGAQSPVSRLSATSPNGSISSHCRTNSTDSLDDSQSSDSASGHSRQVSNDSTNTDANNSYLPTRIIKSSVKPAHNPMQFVKIGTCSLYKKAEEQLKKADEVKKKKTPKQDEEEWQSNLDNWKSKRRQIAQKTVERVEETKKFEEEHLLENRPRRKSKTFNEMMEERSKRGLGRKLSYYSDEWDDTDPLANNQFKSNGWEDTENQKHNASLDSTGSDQVFQDDDDASSFERAAGTELIIEVILPTSDQRDFGFLTKCQARGMIFVETITERGPADNGGLKQGDEILAINGESVRSRSHSDIIFAIKQAVYTRRLELIIYRYDNPDEIILTTDPKGVSSPGSKKQSRMEERRAVFSRESSFERESTPERKFSREKSPKVDVVKRRSLFENPSNGKNDFQQHRRSLDSSSALKQRIASFENLDNIDKQQAKKKILGTTKDSAFKEKLKSFETATVQSERRASYDHSKNFRQRLTSFENTENEEKPMERKASTDKGLLKGKLSHFEKEEPIVKQEHSRSCDLLDLDYNDYPDSGKVKHAPPPVPVKPKLTAGKEEEMISCQLNGVNEKTLPPVADSEALEIIQSSPEPNIIENGIIEVPSVIPSVEPLQKDKQEMNTNNELVSDLTEVDATNELIDDSESFLSEASSLDKQPVTEEIEKNVVAPSDLSDTNDIQDISPLIVNEELKIDGQFEELKGVNYYTSTPVENEIKHEEMNPEPLNPKEEPVDSPVEMQTIEDQIINPPEKEEQIPNVNISVEQQLDQLDFSTLGEEVIVIDDFDFDAPPKILEPPKEKPPPPPVEMEPVNDGSSNTYMASKLKRVESTKRIRKEIWRRRSDFLGIESEQYVDAVPNDVLPSPDVSSLLQPEKMFECQQIEVETSKKNVTEIDRPDSCIEPCQSAHLPEEDEIARKEREIIENLEREEQQKNQHIKAHPLVEAHVPESEDDRIHRLEEERRRMEEERHLREEERIRFEEEKKLREKEEQLRCQEELLRLEREKLRCEQEELMREREEYQRQIQHYQAFQPLLNAATVNGTVLPKQGADPPVSIQPSSFIKSDAKPPAPPPGNKSQSISHELRERDEALRISRRPGLESQAFFNSESNPSSGDVPSDYRPQQMSKQTLYALSAPPKAKIVEGEQWLARRKPENAPTAYNQHWVYQEAEMRRINEQQDRLRRSHSPGRKELPREVKTVPSQRTSGSSHVSNGIPMSSNEHEKHFTDSVINPRSQNMLHKTASVPMPRHQVPAPERRDFAETIAPPPPPKNYPNSQNIGGSSDSQMLSVSGKKKCSHCGEELGRGAAMIIESLKLFYHIHCFKCCVCHMQLGNGMSGADVRVRNQKLHCHNCYSNDEAGLKFSKV